jgi:hypothetical protein
MEDQKRKNYSNHMDRDFLIAISNSNSYSSLSLNHKHHLSANPVFRSEIHIIFLHPKFLYYLANYKVIRCSR